MHDSITQRGFPPDRNVIYTNLGRAAFEAAFRAEGLKGGRIMLPGFICQGSFTSLFDRLDITPVFVDVDPETYHIGLDAARAVDDVDAVMIIHSFGLPADGPAWKQFCADRGIPLIEDCVRALGAEVGGEPVGSFGEYGIYSLKKVSPVGIGGALVCRDSSPGEYLEPAQYGGHALYHLLPQNLQAELAVSYSRDFEPRRLDAVTQSRFQQYLESGFEESRRKNKEIADLIRDSLEPLGFEFQPEAPGRTRFLLPALVPEGVDRDGLVAYVYANSAKSHTKVVWANPWPKSYHANEFGQQFPNTQMLAERTFSFWVNEIAIDDLSRTLQAVREYVEVFGTE